MGAIKVLPSEIYNKIAAGEVVERPSSVIKELVENSIDAEASCVEIVTEGGGIEQIVVSDNGSGIAEDDIDVAFLNHSTSKLYSTRQLFNIKTLGFRGEALSSIAAVSRVSMTSKTPFSDVAVQVEVEEGKIASKKYTSANVGTKIVVSDLFYNIPARKKFLKSASREASDVTQFVSRLILTNPFLEVRYISNGKTIYDFKGTGLEEAIHCVYGANCLKNCLPINSIFNDIVVKGYIGNIDLAKSNTTHQTISLNGRYIKSVLIQSAVRHAYSSFLMTRTYPFFVLDIKLPSDRVDVNVHPNKLEVRFEENRDIFLAVSIPVKAALKKFSEQRVDNIFLTDPTFNIENQPPEQAPKNVFVEYSQQNDYLKTEDLSEKYAESDNLQMSKNNEQSFKKLLEETDKLTVTGELQKMNSVFPFEQHYTISKQRQAGENSQEKGKQDGVEENTQQKQQSGGGEAKQAGVIEGNWQQKEQNGGVNSTQKSQNVQQSFVEAEQFDFTKIKIAGAAFSTYLMLESDENLILVDQHAAHERLLFDKYMSDLDAKIVQPLMFPYVFSVSAMESQFLLENLEEIRQAGIILEEFGTNTFRVSEVAAAIADINLKSFVNGLLQSVEEFKLDSKQLILEKIAKRACRAAVKGGTKLSSTEIEAIIKDILQNKVLQCPHGRPITITIAKTELEKMFKRIV